MASNVMPSVIIPVKNAEQTIGQLLGSLLLQSYRPLEIIIVTGASSDNTMQIIESFLKTNNSDDFMLRLLAEQDFAGQRGPAHARNIGIKKSRGKFLIFLDADFVLLKENDVSNTVNALKNYSAVSARVNPLVETWIEEQIALDTYVRKEKTYVHCYYAIRRNLLNGLLFDERLAFGEDFDLFNRCSIKPVLIDVTLGRHFPSSLTEYINEVRWYGRTGLPFISKKVAYLKIVLRTFALYALPIMLLFFSVVSIVINQMVIFLFLCLSFFILGLVQLSFSPKKTISRFFYLLLIKPVFKVVFFGLGIFETLSKKRKFENKDQLIIGGSSSAFHEC